MLLTIERHPMVYQGGTLSNLMSEDGEIACFTLERAWLDNRPSISCVPAGEYELIPHIGPKYQDTWALRGRTVSVVPDPDYERWGILFHAANYHYQLAGCIAPGYTAGMVATGNPPSVGVFSSRPAMEEIEIVLGIGTTGHWLHIIDP